MNPVYTIEVERIGAFDWTRDAVPIKRDPLWAALRRCHAMSERFTKYDQRRYRTVDVAAGYAEWAKIYDRSVDRRFDLDLLKTLANVPWGTLGNAVDLGCGTGRIGAWLGKQGAARVAGLDRSPAMLKRAARKGHYAGLAIGDIVRAPFADARFDLAISVLATCHVADIRAFYGEAARLVRPGGYVVLLDYHPFMLVRGIPTHFKTEAGTQLAIENWVHFFEDHVAAARTAGLGLLEMRERLVDRAWIRAKPGMGSIANEPVSFAMVWRRP